MASQTTSPTSPQSSSLPNRSATGNTTDTEDAVPGEDSSEVTRLFHERLQAWKHACGYFEDYITATEKLQGHSSKEYEKVLKTVNSPLKEGHHFHQQNGGIAGLFENIRSNTQGMVNSHTETGKTLKGSVLPIFERLHGEIKNKAKELDKGAGKGSKAVDKARNESQKHIELLGSQSAAFDSRGGNVKATEDPYIIQRQVYHRLNKQVMEENANRDDMIEVQNNFAQFETHVIQTFQQGFQQFNQAVSNQAEQTRSMYGDMAANLTRIPTNFEWDAFIDRNNSTLIDPKSPKRSVEHISFANQDHPSTRPLIAGSLERKGHMLPKFEAGYFVVTPSRYLHEFKSDDDFAKDPSPQSSLYLPDCTVGNIDGTAFSIKGKNTSKGALSKMSMSHDYKFKAHTTQDAQKWHQVLSGVSEGSSGGTMGSAPTSPVMNDKQQQSMSSTTSTQSPTSPQTTTATSPNASTSSTGGTTTGTSTMPPQQSEKAPLQGPSEDGVARQDSAPHPG